MTERPSTATLAPVKPEVPLQIAVGAATHVGGRPENEDAISVNDLPVVVGAMDANERGYLLAVADGMGGYQRGEVASKMAIETVQTMFAEDPGADMALLLKQAFRRANEKIYQGGLANGPDAMMGTTLVVAAIRGKYATIASIGDSRAYLARANRMTQVTKDHSLVAEQVARGSLTADEARESPHRNILTHALGHKAKLDSKMPSIFELTLLPEDRLVLLTDGFFDVMPDDDLLQVVLDNPAEVAVQRLVDTAVERGASDNVSAVIAAVQPIRVEAPVVVSTGARPSFLLPAAALVLLIVVLALLVLFVI